MKGLYSWVGFKQIAVPFEVQPRKSGTSQWSFYSLLDLAITGITSFTAFPLRMIALGGIGVATLAILYAAWIIFSTFTFRHQNTWLGNYSHDHYLFRWVTTYLP